MRDAGRRRQVQLDLRELLDHLAQRLPDVLVAQLLVLLQVPEGLRQLAGEGRLEPGEVLFHAVQAVAQLLELGLGARGIHRTEYYSRREGGVPTCRASPPRAW